MTTFRSDRWWPLATAALIALTGCKPASEGGNAVAPTPSATPSPAAAGVKTMPADAQLKLAFRTAYGTDGAARVAAADTEFVKVSPARLLWLGDTAVLLSAGPNETDCHACSGAVAIAYLKPKGEGFEVAGSWPGLVRGSGWGASPDWRLTDQFTTNPAIYVESGWSGQGYSCGAVTLTELKPDGPVQSGPIGLSSDNDGAVDDRTGKTFGGEPRKNLSGKIVDIVKDRSFAVRATGTANFVEKYEYRDGKFVSLQPESRLSC